MAEKKPGFLKKIFSFGFGKKKNEEVEEQTPAIEAPIVEDVQALATEAAKQAEIEAVAETEKAEADRLEKDEAIAKAAAEIEVAKELARKEQNERDEAQRKQQEEAKQEAVEVKRLADEVANAEAEQRAVEKKQAAIAEQERLDREAQRVAEFAEAEALAAQEAIEQAELEADLDEEADEAFDEDAPLEEEELIEPRAPKSTTSGEMAVTLTERKAKPIVEAEPEPEVETRKIGWLGRLTKGLSRSSTALTENITKVFTDKKLDDDTLQELEDVLIQADLGIETAMKITDALSAQKFGKTVTDQEVREIMAEEIEKILAPVAVDLDLDLEHQPHVILMIGVNGSGKTTTIGKLSQKLYDAGFSTSLIAGDTFRAAAIEQLKVWGERTQSPVLSRPLGADSAGLAYDAWEMARDERRDVMLMDTAGRLQNRTELMEELAKIVRVLKKQDPSAPHTVLLTLDATTGQNALNQVEIFKEVAGVNGLVMTKLDGTARGGIMVAIAAKYKLPVYFVGVGEQVEDLEPFEARDFARSIAGLPREE